MHLSVAACDSLSASARPGVPSVSDTDEHPLDLGAGVPAWRRHPAGSNRPVHEALGYKGPIGDSMVIFFF